MQIGPAQKISLIAYKLNGKAYSEKDQGFQLMERNKVKTCREAKARERRGSKAKTMHNKTKQLRKITV